MEKDFIVSVRKLAWGKDYTYVEKNGNAQASMYIYWDKPDVSYIGDLYVNENIRRNGMGTKLLEAIFKKCDELKIKKCALLCSEDSWMHDWYERIGFRKIKPDGSGLVWMEKQL